MMRSLISDPMVAVATAIWAAANLVCQLGLSNLKLEGDFLVVVKTLSNEDRSWTNYGHLPEEVKIILNNCQSWEVSHVSNRRLANEAANRVAKMTVPQMSTSFG